MDTSEEVEEEQERHLVDTPPLMACSLVELDSRAERDSRCFPCPGLTLAIGSGTGIVASTPPATPSGITARLLFRGLPEAVFFLDMGRWPAAGGP